MSDNKLDKSLDDILSTRRQTARGRGRGRRAGTAASRVTKAAPVGGVQKSTKAKTGSKNTAPTPAKTGTGKDTKAIVSNLPSDVNEAQIKEYFGKSVGPVKRVMLTYGPNGVSRGVATIIFSKAGDANKALTELEGVLVDKRPMKIEVVLDASKVVGKGLDDRVVTTKAAKPKPVTAKAAPKVEKATRGGREGRGGRGGRRGRASNRPKPKTADELDAEMVDYFDANATATAPAEGATATNGAATGGEDLGMGEIS